MNFAALTWSHTSGDVIVDSAVPITDFRATMNAVTPAYVRTFGFFGRAAQVQAVAPIVDGTARGVIAGQDSSRDLDGFADPVLRVAVNLRGGAARSRAQTAGARLGTIVGASLTVSPPLGQYDHARRLNLGAHRWAVKPEVGVVQPWGGAKRWAVEGYAGVWLFADNTAYLDTSTVAQDPVLALQGHLIRVLGRRGWIALDATLVRGGSTSIDGVLQNNFQKSVRLGATGMWTFDGGHTLKASFARGAYTRFGGDFDVFALGYLYNWGG